MKTIDPRKLAERLAVIEQVARGIEEPGHPTCPAHDHWDRELNKLGEEIYQEIIEGDDEYLPGPALFTVRILRYLNKIGMLSERKISREELKKCDNIIIEAQTKKD